MKLDPNAPAYPQTFTENVNFEYPELPYAPCVKSHGGLTIRAELAAMAMQGILSNSAMVAAVAQEASETGTAPINILAKGAVAYADALLAELNREEGL